MSNALAPFYEIQRPKNEQQRNPGKQRKAPSVAQSAIRRICAQRNDRGEDTADNARSTDRARRVQGVNIDEVNLHWNIRAHRSSRYQSACNNWDHPMGVCVNGPAIHQQHSGKKRSADNKQREPMFRDRHKSYQKTKVSEAAGEGREAIFGLESGTESGEKYQEIRIYDRSKKGEHRNKTRAEEESKWPQGGIAEHL
ncbi:MAG: hypothetical protein M1821_009692 [Bathelium mastoideum]|nr:MAG: hypothetical protein M1821_009692 [Bathelium mastoideum]